MSNTDEIFKAPYSDPAVAPIALCQPARNRDGGPGVLVRVPLHVYEITATTG